MEKKKKASWPEKVKVRLKKRFPHEIDLYLQSSKDNSTSF